MSCKNKPPKRPRQGPIREPPPIIVEWRHVPTSPERRDQALDALAEFVRKLVQKDS